MQEIKYTKVISVDEDGTERLAKFQDKLIGLESAALQAEFDKRRKDVEDGLRSGQIKSATIREDRRIGRNDPCPCGSGTKFKRCCGKGLAIPQENSTV